MFKKYFLIAIIIFSLVASFILPASLAAEPADGSPARLIVTFDETARRTVKDFIQDKGGQVIRDFKIIPGMAISLRSVQVPELMSIAGVRQVGIDGRVYAIDSELDNSWGVKRIDAGDVHSYNKGSGIKIAIIDTGIDYTHSDLDANSNPALRGYDFVSNDSDPFDDNGHGTHVSGITSAEDNDSGVVGVAPEADLYALKVLDSSGSGYWSDIIAAIEWVVSNGMQVANMSLGASQEAPGVHDAVKVAYNAGIVLVAAAGNSGNPAGQGNNIIYPARFEEVIAVGATDQNDLRASFSSTGDQLELVAPGVVIHSTIPGGGYASYSGTSMASPHVAGTAALVIASGISDSNGNGRINDEVILRLINTADDLGASGKDSQYGYGLINAYKAVSPPLATGSIHGTVTDGTNPISGASVTNGSTTVTTSPDGSYAILDVIPGTYTVTASATGYQNSSQTVSVTSGQIATANFSLTLILNGTITVIVKDASTNSPIAGASVTNSNKTVTTDESGNYTILDAPGTYTVTASAVGYQSSSQSVTVQESTTSIADFNLSPATQVATLSVKSILIILRVEKVTQLILES